MKKINTETLAVQEVGMKAGVNRWIVTLVSVIIMTGLAALPASADFQFVENFDHIPTGAIDGQNGWAANSGTVDVSDVAPATPANKALRNGDGSTGGYRSVPTIVNGSSGTLFFRFYNNQSNPNTGMGLADAVTTGGDWNSFRAYMIVDAGGVFKVRNGGAFANINNVSLTTNTWYDAWIVADNSANTYEAYIQGGAITTQTQLKSGTTGTFAFRNSEPGTADIASFQAPTGAGGFGDNAVFIDDIYVDPAGQNLGKPPIAIAIYTQDFTEDGNSDTDFAAVGWNALGNLDASGLNADVSDEVTSAGISKNDYAFFAPHIGILDTELFLAYTTHFSVNVDVSRVKRVNYSYIGDPTGAVYRVAVRIGSTWYAEATGTADTRNNFGPGGTYLSTAFAPANFAAAANWVTVQNATVGAFPMALGTAPVSDLSGMVTAIGLLLDQGEGSGDHMRFDAFTLVATPPFQGTIIMVQ